MWHSRPFPQKLCSQYKSDFGSLHTLDHFSLQVVDICNSNGLWGLVLFCLFSWDWEYFCVNWIIHKEGMRKCVVRRLEFTSLETQLGEFVGRECSLWQVQSIADNQLIVYSCLCCKNNCRSCNMGREKLALVHASFLLPYTF